MVAANARPAELDRLSSRTRAEVRATVASAAFGVERQLAVARILFYIGLLVQAALSRHRLWPSLLANTPLVVGILFSIYVLGFARKVPTGSGFFIVSVMLDTVAAHMALAENIFSPGRGYAGILTLPETSGILICTAGAGLRLSLAAAVWGGAANAAGVAALVHLDRAILGARLGNSEYNADFYYLFIGTMTLLAVITAITIRKLVLRAANVALRADRVERGLGTVLADCHDARSVLAAARLNAEMIQEDASLPGSDASGSVRTRAESLIENLSAVESLVLGVKDRALADLCAAEPPAAVAVYGVVERAVEQLRPQFRDVRIEHEQAEAALSVWISGGELALRRVVINLLANACEGDGQKHAAAVAVSVNDDPVHENVMIRVDDDGPGFGDIRERMSSKTNGAGVGLSVVRGIVEASGGRFFMTRRREGGTTATVIFPAERDRSSTAAKDQRASATPAEHGIASAGHVPALPAAMGGDPIGSG
jgi:signal transduction histidine kinase